MTPKSSVLGFLVFVTDRTTGAGMFVLAALRAAERVLLTVVALSFSIERLGAMFTTTVVLGLLAIIRATVRAPLIARVRLRVVACFADALLHRRGSATQAESSVLLFDGLWVAEELLIDRAPMLAADAIAAIVLGVLALTYLSTRLVVVGGTALIVAGVALQIARRVAGAHGQRSYDAFMPVAASIDGCATGGVELLANGRAHQQEKVVLERAARWAKIGTRADWLAGVSGRMPVLVGFLGLMIGAIYVDVSRGATLEAAFAGALLLASFLPPYASLLTNLVSLTKVRPWLVPLAEILAASSPQTAPANPEVLGPITPAPIRWTALEHAYEGTDTLALASPKGEWLPDRILGIAGPNGAGKTTLFRLLLALDRPSRGTILVGEAPLADLEPEAWRRSIAYLPQRPFFPTDAGIREGIHFLVPEASDERMERMLRRVGIWARLAREPRPLEVPIATLSAGERQRVALARILLREDAPILLLDEPDANLDRSGALLVAEILRAERSRRMIAFIAHDEELLTAADDVLRLAPSAAPDEGRRRVEQPNELENDF
jgi:ABC-type multidrug transport system fused ATPase/permease subunit